MGFSSFDDPKNPALVEVQGDNGAYYMAIVKNVYPEKNQVLLKFERDWMPEGLFPFNRVRFPPTKQEAPQNCSEGNEVEVFARASGQESCGWWRAVIQRMKGDFYVVEYLGHETALTDIVSSDLVRAKSLEPELTASSFTKFSIRLPSDVNEFFQHLTTEELEEQNKDFKVSINACIIEYSKPDKTLNVIARDETSQRKAGMLQEMHFRNITQRIQLKKRTEEAAKCLEKTRIQSSHAHVEEFQVSSDLMGLAIGAHGSNIQQVFLVN